MEDLNVGLEIIKLLEENIGGKLLDANLPYNILDLEPKGKANKIKINKTTSDQTAFAQQKKLNKMKRQPTEWEGIFENHITQISISKIYLKNSYNSIAKKQTT